MDSLNMTNRAKIHDIFIVGATVLNFGDFLMGWQHLQNFSSISPNVRQAT